MIGCVGTCANEGYLMIKSLTIRHFRCFKDLKLSGTRRVNVLVGESGTGKTAFLEALFMLCGVNPEIYLRTRRFRGFSSTMEFSGESETYESLWRDLFFGLDQDKPIFVQMKDNIHGERWLNISYHGQPVLAKPTSSDMTNPMVTRPITFEWHAGSGKTNASKVTVGSNGQLELSGFDEAYPGVFVYPSSVSAKDNARRFSVLSKKNKHQRLIEAVRQVYPRVKDLSVEILTGEATLYVTLDYLSEKLPISVLSGGINKFICILLAVTACENGVVMIDEVESGFYYKSLPAMLKVIYELAVEYTAQLFLSTHSYELLESLIPSMDGREHDFALLRTVQKNDGSCAVQFVDGHAYKAAIKQDFEVR
jgi:AAA15 family ATPase/GTPase